MQSSPPIERYRLISIGIARAYRGSRWGPLKAPVSDAEAVRNVLVSKYGFEVEAELHEERATRDAIVDALRKYARSSRETDALVIYYAGHGHLDDLTASGSWIPCDAAEGESRWVDNDSIKKLIGAMKARHVLLLSDSCFSGVFFRGDRREFPGVTKATVDLAAARCAREAITSGGVEPVVDEGLGGKSPYAHWVVKALEANEKEHLLASELFQRILGGVTHNAPQLPKYGPLFGTGGEADGQFVFRNHFFQERATELPLPSFPDPGPGDSIQNPLSPPQAVGEVRVFGKMADRIAARRRKQEEEERTKAREEAERKKRFEAQKVWLETDMEDLKAYEADPFVMREDLEEGWAEICEKYGVPPVAYESGIRLQVGLEQGVEVVLPPFISKGRDVMLTLPGELDLQLKWIKAGTFLMGSPEGEKDRSGNETPHEVTLTKGYWLGVYPVTQGQWQALMGNNPADFKESGLEAPVENVSWEDAVAFCRKLTEVERAAGRLPEGYEYALPTEAQWEYACRAGTTRAFCYGDSLSGGQANFDGNYPYGEGRKGGYLERTVKVGSYEPNAWGLYDMHGNVWEWCQDWYGDYPKGAVIDPTGPGEGQGRVLRGGSWHDLARDCRSAYRNGDGPDCRDSLTGFRFLLQVQNSQNQ